MARYHSPLGKRSLFYKGEEDQEPTADFQSPLKDSLFDRKPVRLKDKLQNQKIVYTAETEQSLLHVARFYYHNIFVPRSRNSNDYSKYYTFPALGLIRLEIAGKNYSILKGKRSIEKGTRLELPKLTLDFGRNIIAALESGINLQDSLESKLEKRRMAQMQTRTDNTRAVPMTEQYEPQKVEYTDIYIKASRLQFKAFFPKNTNSKKSRFTKFLEDLEKVLQESATGEENKLSIDSKGGSGIAYMTSGSLNNTAPIISLRKATGRVYTIEIDILMDMMSVYGMNNPAPLQGIKGQNSLLFALAGHIKKAIADADAANKAAVNITNHLLRQTEETIAGIEKVDGFIIIPLSLEHIAVTALPEPYDFAGKADARVAVFPSKEQARKRRRHRSFYEFQKNYYGQSEGMPTGMFSCTKAGSLYYRNYLGVCEIEDGKLVRL